MWSVGWYVGALVVIALSHWTYRWRKPRCNGRLPPGSMGFPLIGETIQFLAPSKSLDIHPFIKKRVTKYGPVFRTSLVGRPVVISTNPDFNHFVLQQEGKLVQLWYLDSFDALFDGLIPSVGHVHKYIRSLVLKHLGLETIKAKLLPEMAEMVDRALHVWASKGSVEVKHATAMMIFDFTSKLLFSYDPDEKSGESMGENFTNFFQALLTFPLNIPGTAFHRCLQKQKKALKIIRDMMEERRASPEKRVGDFLDHVMDDMKNETFLTDKFVGYVMFALLFASFETISTTLTLLLKLLTEHPLVAEELLKENEEILGNRENTNDRMTWKEYKSMTFTMQVINESLRLVGAAPGLVRKVIKDIHIDGYTIPQGWTFMVASSAVHLNPDTFEDPLTFNPYRWKDLGANLTAKNFIPFGGGMRYCVGAEYSKAWMAVFLHVLVTKYKWTKINEGKPVRAPVLGFGNGYHVKVSKKLQ